MKFRIFDEEVEDFQKDIEINKDNSNSEIIKKNILSKNLNSVYTTALDYAGTFFSLPGQAAGQMYKDEIISKTMSDLFENTQVNCYVYESKILNAFTIPGAMSDQMIYARIIFLFPLLNRIPMLRNLLQLILSIMNIEILKNAIMTNANNKNNLLIYNPLNNKFSLSFSSVTVFISSGLVEALNINEIKAALLHEIGHNTQIVCSIISNIVEMSFGGFTLYQLFNLKNLKFLFKDFPESGIYVRVGPPMLESKMYIKTIYYALFIMVLFTFITQYLKRRQEIYADEFAIKCGYGKDLENAIEKLKGHSLSFFGKYAIKMNLLDKFLNFFNKIFANIINFFGMFKLSTYDDINTRIRKIKEKIAEYDASEKNIDRSNVIRRFIV